MAKPRLATCSLAGCFGCHMSLLDIDERFVELLDLVDLDKSPLDDKKNSTASSTSVWWKGAAPASTMSACSSSFASIAASSYRLAPAPLPAASPQCGIWWGCANAWKRPISRGLRSRMAV